MIAAGVLRLMGWPVTPWRLAAVRGWTALMLTVGAGVAQQAMISGSLYVDEGVIGVYAHDIGVEWSADDVTDVRVWVCREHGRSWRCPEWGDTMTRALWLRADAATGLDSEHLPLWVRGWILAEYPDMDVRECVASVDVDVWSVRCMDGRGVEG